MKQPVRSHVKKLHVCMVELKTHPGDVTPGPSGRLLSCD